jgi:hypothetical protein
MLSLDIVGGEHDQDVVVHAYVAVIGGDGQVVLPVKAGVVNPRPPVVESQRPW